MTEQQFCYWLQGFVEIQETERPSEQQWQIIKDHLQLVFKKETPDRQYWGDKVQLKQVVMPNNSFIKEDDNMLNIVID